MSRARAERDGGAIATNADRGAAEAAGGPRTERCAHPIIESKEEGAGICMTCDEPLGLIDIRGQPIGRIGRRPDQD